MTTDPIRETLVVAAVIVRDGRMLITRRRPGLSMAGKWELPGGKVNAGETPEQALRRELHEELGIDARIGELLGAVPHGTPAAPWRFLFYAVSGYTGTFAFTDHDMHAWAATDELAAYDFTPPDAAFIRRLAAPGAHAD